MAFDPPVLVMGGGYAILGRFALSWVKVGAVFLVSVHPADSALAALKLCL